MNNDKIRVDFFHDPICGWCYVLSPRVRKLVDEFNLDVHHHAFALSPTREHNIRKFGSIEQTKEIILGHWERCAEADDDKRINVDGMRQQTFEYPISMPGLIACKAAAQQGGNPVYWDYFDAVTRAHLTENRNIADVDVLTAIAGEIGLDSARFSEDYASPTRIEEIEQDRVLAERFSVSSTPTMIINEQWVLPGAVDSNALRNAFADIRQKISA